MVSQQQEDSNIAMCRITVGSAGSTKQHSSSVQAAIQLIYKKPGYIPCHVALDTTAIACGCAALFLRQPELSM
jgi:hypothetical protein